MITSLRGKVLEAKPMRVVVDVSGVGYEVIVPLSTHNRLPQKNGDVTLLIHHYFGTRFDPSQRLFGFLTIGERDMYETLLDVGIGPKVALNVVGGIAPDVFQSAVAAGDIKAISAIPSVGKKLAERIILELRGKLGEGLPVAGEKLPAEQQLIADAAAALVSLGYKPIEAHQAARKAASKLGKKADLESVIRTALK